MPEQKISDFRERAQAAVIAPDPDLMLQRGREMRRRRQLVPVAALAACLAIGYGVLATGAGDSRTEQPPAGQPTVSDAPDQGPTLLGASRLGNPGSYLLDSVGDGQPDATVDLVGDGWEAWGSGAVTRDSTGVASWGFQKYEDTPIPSCHPNRPRASSLSGAVDQLSNTRATVTQAARPASKLGLSGTYLQLSVPYTLPCDDRMLSGGLMASWTGAGGGTVMVDVWLLEDANRLLILTRGVRGNPSAATLADLDQTLDTLEYLPSD